MGRCVCFVCAAAHLSENYICNAPPTLRPLLRLAHTPQSHMAPYCERKCDFKQCVRVSKVRIICTKGFGQALIVADDYYT